MTGAMSSGLTADRYRNRAGMTIARIAAWIRRPRLSAAAWRAIERLARAASPSVAEDLAGRRRRLLGASRDDERVVHEPQVAAGLAAADPEQDVGRRARLA